MTRSELNALYSGVISYVYVLYSSVINMLMLEMREKIIKFKRQTQHVTCAIISFTVINKFKISFFF